jgi:lysophospholipid acyltransferase (LPLAT)-like uncharacterized protein
MGIGASAGAALAGDLLVAASHAVAPTISIGTTELGPLSGSPVIGVGWHGQVAAALRAMPMVLGGRPIAVMTLASIRGQVLARYARRLGMTVVEIGQQPLDRLGAAARLSQLTRSGCLGFLAADGPAGPALQAKDAIVLVAQRAGAMLVPCALAADRFLELRWRWDRHVVPLPGARVVFHVGAPIDPGAAGDTAATQQARIALQHALVDVNCAARELLRTGNAPRAAHALE